MCALFKNHQSLPHLINQNVHNFCLHFDLWLWLCEIIQHFASSFSRLSLHGEKWTGYFSKENAAVSVKMPFCWARGSLKGGISSDISKSPRLFLGSMCSGTHRTRHMAFWHHSLHCMIIGRWGHMCHMGSTKTRKCNSVTQKNERSGTLRHSFWRSDGHALHVLNSPFPPFWLLSHNVVVSPPHSLSVM